MEQGLNIEKSTESTSNTEKKDNTEHTKNIEEPIKNEINKNKT